MKSRLLGVVCACILTLIATTSQAALIERLGGLAYYDDVADLTWLADANAAVGSVYDTYAPGSGTMNWSDANTWVASLNVAGVAGWRLPDTIDVGNDGATYINRYQGVDYGYNITVHSELSNMFYNVLGNTAAVDINGSSTGCYIAPDYCLTNTGPFSNLQPGYYMSATEYAPNNTQAWDVDMRNGNQSSSGKTDNDSTGLYYAWAVYSGDVAAVPIPPALYLFASGLIGLVGVARRRVES